MKCHYISVDSIDVRMRIAVYITLLLVGFVSSAPTSKDDTLIITDDFFVDELKIYEAEHDIVKIYVPLNNLNFEDKESTEESSDDEIILFFVEADKKDGALTDQGLYVRKGTVVKKLLDNGRDIDAPKDESKLAYFAAKEGLYKYNFEKNEAEKYGSVDDDLKGIAVGNTSDYLYVLTVNKDVYKVTDDGNKKVKVDDVTNAEQIIMDMSNNLFYLDSDKKLFVVNSGGVKAITGLPSDASTITLARAPIMYEEGIPVVADNSVYSVYPNGTVSKEDIKLNLTSAITAYSAEVLLIQYYAHDKKIYEYNLLIILLGQILEELKTFLDDMKTEIQEVATRSRSNAISKAR